MTQNPWDVVISILKNILSLNAFVDQKTITLQIISEPDLLRTQEKT